MSLKNRLRPLHCSFETLRLAGPRGRFPAFATQEQLSALGMTGNPRFPARPGILDAPFADPARA